MLQEKPKIRVVEPYYDSYQNLWYLVKKTTSRKYKHINIVVEFNKVTFKYVNLPLFTDKFSEKFAGYAISSLIDFFSGYN